MKTYTWKGCGGVRNPGSKSGLCRKCYLATKKGPPQICKKCGGWRSPSSKSGLCRACSDKARTKSQQEYKCKECGGKRSQASSTGLCRSCFNKTKRARKSRAVYHCRVCGKEKKNPASLCTNCNRRWRAPLRAKVKKARTGIERWTAWAADLTPPTCQCGAPMRPWVRLWSRPNGRWLKNGPWPVWTCLTCQAIQEDPLAWANLVLDKKLARKYPAGVAEWAQEWVKTALQNNLKKA